MELPKAIDKIRPTVVQIALIAEGIAPEEQEKYGSESVNVPARAR